MKTQHLVIICASLIIGVFVWRHTDRGDGSGGHQPRYNQKATINAFVEAKKLWDVSAKAPDWSLAKSGQYDSFIAQVQQYTSHMQSLANNTRAIDMAGVDPQVSDVILSAAELFDREASWSSDYAQCGASLKEFNDSYNSGVAFLEAFLRGALGDPFGKANEQIAAERQLKSMLANNQRLAEQVQAEASKILEREARIRAYLQSEYHAR